MDSPGEHFTHEEQLPSSPIPYAQWEFVRLVIFHHQCKPVAGDQKGRSKSRGPLFALYGFLEGRGVRKALRHS